MAEKSIRIADAASGLRMAVRDAYEYGEGYDRVIERVDFSCGKFPSTILTSPNRGSAASPLTSADTLDLTNLPTELFSNVLTVGDKPLLGVFCHLVTSTSIATITPIVFNAESPLAPVAVLVPKIFNATQTFRFGSSSGNYTSMINVWDVCGAYYLGLHLTALQGSGAGVIIYAWVM